MGLWDIWLTHDLLNEGQKISVISDEKKDNNNNLLL